MVAWLNARGNSLLNLFDYEVKNPKGNDNLSINILDAILFIAYFGVSVFNLKNATPTVYVIVLNEITLLRFIVKNTLEQRRITKKSSAKMTKIHIIKIVVEFCLVFLSTLVCVYHLTIAEINNCNVDYGLIIIFIFLILVASLFENLLLYLERTFDAVPRLMKYIA